MKLIYSELQKLIPSLSVDPKTLSHDLALMGHFVSALQKDSNDFILDLEIRQNRADALGYYGIAKDVSVYYGQPLVIPSPTPDYPSGPDLPIKITAKNYVKRIMAVKISDITNSPSPQWLSRFLSLHQINPINTLVDLTNYIMFLYGIPNHAFDTAKSGDELTWEQNHQFKKFTTLDGTKLDLTPGLLMVNNPASALSLSFLGGQSCSIDLSTKETIIEMAVYDRSKVRSDSRQLKTITEASIRLDKDLDSELIPQSFNHLVSLILQHCGGHINSQLFEYYPQPVKSPQIKFDPAKPSQYAGITIPSDFSLDVLSRLGCRIKDGLVTPPTLRKDITIEEDLIEEVIRFWGYNQIPTDQTVSSKKLPDITPKITYLTQMAKDIMVHLGYDEVRSWPLIKPDLLIPEFLKEIKPIYTQNSINSEYPILRHSLISSLKEQKHQYSRYKLPHHQFFEIGKIFYNDTSGKYTEKHSLAFHHQLNTQAINDLHTLLNNLKINQDRVGDCYRTNTDSQGNVYHEIILDDLVGKIGVTPTIGKLVINKAYELTTQIHTFDANVTLPREMDPAKLIKKYSALIGNQHLWQISIIDIYKNKTTKDYRYTFRVSYFDTTSSRAKEIHLKAFDLTS